MVLPDCTCGQASRGPGAGHRLSCAIVAAAGIGRRDSPAAGGSAPPRGFEVPRGPVVTPAPALDGLGRSRGVLTTVRGIGFRTRLEALVATRLWELEEAKGAAAGVIVRQVRFDLWTSWRPGLGAPLRFTPDFVVLRPGVLEVHEAKGPKVAESRDFVTRLAAFRAMLPWAPVTIWRRDREAGPSAIVRAELPPLAAG